MNRVLFILRNGPYKRAVREHNTMTRWNLEGAAFAIIPSIVLPAHVVFGLSHQYRLGVSRCCCPPVTKVFYASRPTTTSQVTLRSQPTFVVHATVRTSFVYNSFHGTKVHICPGSHTRPKFQNHLWNARSSAKVFFYFIYFANFLSLSILQSSERIYIYISMYI